VKDRSDKKHTLNEFFRKKGRAGELNKWLKMVISPFLLI